MATPQRIKSTPQKTDVSGMIQKLNDGSRKDFDVMLHELSNPETQTSVLISHFQGLRECITMLSKNNEHLVGVVLKMEWSGREATFVQEYQSFLLNLVSAHTVYLKACMRSLVQRFMPKIGLVPPGQEIVVSADMRAEHERSFMNVHAVIKAIASIVPMTPAILLPLLPDSYPYMGKDTYILECYLKNILTVTQYLPQLRRQILELIVERLTKLDVRCSRQEIAEAEDDASDEDDDDSDHGLFDMDADDSMNNSHDDKKTSVSESQRMAHKDAHKLDILMDLMYQFIYQSCFIKGALDWEATKLLYRELLLVFENILLPTYASNHVQFIMFYICSFKQPLVEGFIDYLWKKIQEPNTQTIFRQAAVAYLSSLLARGTYVQLSTVSASLDLMCQWAHRYINQAIDTSTQANALHHGAFYSVCQAIFYTFIFRHKDLLESKKGIKFVQGLNFQSIVTCRLNPLKLCLPIVVKTFASITRQYQLAFCDTIIERNNRCALPVVNPNGPSGLSSQNTLDSFFPFDPYLLVKSSSFITPIYRVYSGNVEEQDEDGMEEEDDFLPPSTTPESGIAMKQSLGKSPADFMQYGTSPGFMHM